MESVDASLRGKREFPSVDKSPCARGQVHCSCPQRAEPRWGRNLKEQIVVGRSAGGRRRSRGQGPFQPGLPEERMFKLNLEQQI